MTTAGVLLAAGSSRRFGDADKLIAPLAGHPLVSHAARALSAVEPEILIAVTRTYQVAALLDGFDVVRLDNTKPAQADSLRAGVARAIVLGASRAVVVLGDMPFVTPALIDMVISRSTGTTPAAATDGKRPMPPACFPAACFSKLMAQSGDRGAADLIKALPPSALVAAPSLALRDIDTPAALDAAQNPTE
ncbi:MAG: nucleotidyltransferase family protein [Pseudomonadota bacterium]